MKITETIKYIGVDDLDIDLFESQYIVPNGVSYNSYVIMDEKVSVMDTCDKRKMNEWFENLENALEGKTPDYLVISHLEPDHAGSIGAFCEKYPLATLVVNDKILKMLPQFFNYEFEQRSLVVKEGDTLNLGSHTLEFYMAPMVHWPEVMVTYEKSEKVLFSADGFGKFGALSCDEPWDCEARRYYINIVGKYGSQVQALLKKAATLDIEIICPLHGPSLTENLGHYIEKYDIWSSSRPENEGVVIAYASIHGNTGEAARHIASEIEKTGTKVSVFDLARDDWAEAVEDAFRYDRLICAAATYDGFMFPPMEKFLGTLKKKSYQKRKVALVENGSWAPMAGKLMREYFDSFKEIDLYDKTLSIKSTLKDGQADEVKALVEFMVK